MAYASSRIGLPGAIREAAWTIASASITNINPKIDLIVDQQVEWTGSAEYADVVLPANTWLEFRDLECGASCSNPFLQLWGGEGIEPLYNSRDDGMIFALVPEKLTELTGDERFRNHWKFVLEGKSRVYLQRVFDNSTTTQGYKVSDIMAGKYGEPGAALMLFRTYPRVPFYEQVHDSNSFYTDTGRLNAYCDIPDSGRLRQLIPTLFHWLAPRPSTRREFFSQMERPSENPGRSILMAWNVH